VTDNVALFLALMESAEGPEPCCKLEVSRTYYDHVNFVAKVKVYVNGEPAFELDAEDLLGECLRDRARAFERVPTRYTKGGVGLID
jgi:hypothetical protein